MPDVDELNDCPSFDAELAALSIFEPAPARPCSMFASVRVTWPLRSTSMLTFFLSGTAASAASHTASFASARPISRSMRTSTLLRSIASSSARIVPSFARASATCALTVVVVAFGRRWISLRIDAIADCAPRDSALTRIRISFRSTAIGYSFGVFHHSSKSGSPSGARRAQLAPASPSG
jgi:hypothetical protein